MDIEGLGPAAVQNLVDAKLVSSAADLTACRRRTWRSWSGWAKNQRTT
jgi:NAD-dependent DNA ligase